MEDDPHRNTGHPFGLVPRVARLLIEPEVFEVQVTAPGWPHPTDLSHYPILVDVNQETQAIEGRRVRYLALAPARPHEISPDGGVAADDIPASDFGRPAVLTVREIQVLNELAKGVSNKSIARTLGISTGTVRVHVKSVLRKLALDNRTQAAVWATAKGMRSES